MEEIPVPQTTTAQEVQNAAQVASVASSKIWWLIGAAFFVLLIIGVAGWMYGKVVPKTEVSTTYREASTTAAYLSYSEPIYVTKQGVQVLVPRDWIRYAALETQDEDRKATFVSFALPLQGDVIKGNSEAERLSHVFEVGRIVIQPVNKFVSYEDACASSDGPCGAASEIDRNSQYVLGAFPNPHAGWDYCADAKGSEPYLCDATKRDSVWNIKFATTSSQIVVAPWISLSSVTGATFLIQNGKVYSKTSENLIQIFSADAATFVVPDASVVGQRLAYQYAKDRSHVYYRTRIDGSVRTIDAADPTTFVVVVGQLDFQAQDKNHKYWADGVICEDSTQKTCVVENGPGETNGHLMQVVQ